MIGELIEQSNGIQTGASLSINNLPSIGFSKNISKYKATIISRNREVCSIDASIQKTNYETTVKFDTESYIIKSFGQNNSISELGAVANIISTAIKGEDAISSTLPKIYDSNNNLIGDSQLLFGGSGLNKYSYMKYTINGNNLYAYQLSHDTKDILCCIYNDNQQMIATISKKTKVENGHARYTIYSCNDDWFKYVSLIAICWTLSFTDSDGGTLSVTSQHEITVNPELLSKYNPTFIEQVKQKEGILNQPENMSLVKETVEKSKKSIDVRVAKILAFILFVAIAGVIIYSFIG